MSTNSCRNCKWRTLNHWTCTNESSEFFSKEMWGKNVTCNAWEKDVVEKRPAARNSQQEVEELKEEIKQLMLKIEDLDAEISRLQSLLDAQIRQNKILLDT